LQNVYTLIDAVAAISAINEKIKLKYMVLILICNLDFEWQVAQNLLASFKLPEQVSHLLALSSSTAIHLVHRYGCKSSGLYITARAFAFRIS
jgi:hypothetical protein